MPLCSCGSGSGIGIGLLLCFTVKTKLFRAEKNYRKAEFTSAVVYQFFRRPDSLKVYIYQKYRPKFPQNKMRAKAKNAAIYSRLKTTQTRLRAATV